MDNYNAKTTTEEGKSNISTVVISAKQNQVEGYICNLSHKPSDLNMEDDGRNTTNGFLKDQQCNLCNKMFVEKNKENKETAESPKKLRGKFPNIYFRETPGPNTWFKPGSLVTISW